MAAIIASTDLPSAIQSQELVGAMVAGANAKASRVAPCLVDPTSTAWAASTAYAVGAKVKITVSQFLEATIAGTSGTVAPVVPANIDGTVVDGTVTWKRIAPTADQMAEAKLVLIGAVKRWVEASSGALQSQQAGPYGMTVDTRQRTGYNLWPSEIEALQEICSTGATGREAFAIDTAGAVGVTHAESCALNFGALYCDCGADIAGFPLFESV